MNVVLLSLINAMVPPRYAGKGSDWVLHAEGCADIARTTRYGGVEIDSTGSVESIREEFDRSMDHNSGGYGEPVTEDDPDAWESWWRFDRDVHFAPCCREARRPASEVYEEQREAGWYDGPSVYDLWRERNG